MEWKDIQRSQDDADRLMKVFGGFHDGCASRKPHIWTGCYWVERELSIGCPWNLHNKKSAFGSSGNTPDPSAVELFLRRGHPVQPCSCSGELRLDHLGCDTPRSGRHDFLVAGRRVATRETEPRRIYLDFGQETSLARGRLARRPAPLRTTAGWLNERCEPPIHTNAAKPANAAASHICG